MAVTDIASMILVKAFLMNLKKKRIFRKKNILKYGSAIGSIRVKRQLHELSNLNNLKYNEFSTKILLNSHAAGRDS